MIKLLNNFKNKIKKESVKTVDDVRVDEEAVLPLEPMKLSYHPSWNLSKEEDYAFRYYNRQCEPLHTNRISLVGLNIDPKENGDLEVVAFIRNGLNNPIELENTKLVLLDGEDEVLAKHEFDLSLLQSIPPRSNRPWKFVFPKESIYEVESTADILKMDWKLAFDFTDLQSHRLELDNTWENSLTFNQKRKLEEIVSQLEPPSQGALNFVKIQSTISKNGDLHIVLLIRNGSNKDITLKKLPLYVEDATGELIAKGGFELKDFKVRANTSKPWQFIFPKEQLLKENPDLTTWKVYSK